MDPRPSGAVRLKLDADEGFRSLVVLARVMCADGRLGAQGLSNVLHALASMHARGVLSVDGDATNLRGLVAALERATPRLSKKMTSQAAANAIWALATMRWELGADAWDALEAAVVRLGGARGSMNGQEVANVLWAYATFGWDLAEETWSALDGAVTSVAGGGGGGGGTENDNGSNGSDSSVSSSGYGRNRFPKHYDPGGDARTAMSARAVANALWGFATLGRRPSPAAWKALERTMIRTSDTMNAHDVCNVWWSYVTLESSPSLPAARDALEAATARLTRTMASKDVANVTWALSMLPRDAPPPQESTLTAIERAEVRLAGSMRARDVASALLGHATNAGRRRRLSTASGADAWDSLSDAVGRVGHEMSYEDVSNILWAHAVIGASPSEGAVRAIERAIVRLGGGGGGGGPIVVAPKETSNVFYAYARLGLDPGDDALKALDAAVETSASSMNAQACSITLWSVVALAATRGTRLPGCYVTLWDAASKLDPASFLDANWCAFFHASMIHAELLEARDDGDDGDDDDDGDDGDDGGGGGEMRALLRAARANYPAWLEARSMHWSPYDRVGVVNADP